MPEREQGSKEEGKLRDGSPFSLIAKFYLHCAITNAEVVSLISVPLGQYDSLVPGHTPSIMWSWTSFVSDKTRDFSSYDHRVNVFHLYESPLGEVFLKQVCCTDNEDLIYEVSEHSKIEGVQHECLAECLDWRQEQMEDGSGFLYEVYQTQGPIFDEDIRTRCRDNLRHYPEEYLWRTLKKLIEVHALLQSKVPIT